MSRNSGFSWFHGVFCHSELLTRRQEESDSKKKGLRTADPKYALGWGGGGGASQRIAMNRRGFCRIVENWKTGNWKTGKLENWRTGKLETGKLETGKLENPKISVRNFCLRNSGNPCKTKLFHCFLSKTHFLQPAIGASSQGTILLWTFMGIYGKASISNQNQFKIWFGIPQILSENMVSWL